MTEQTYLKYQCLPGALRPADDGEVRWLDPAEYSLAAAFAKLSEEAWRDCLQGGYTFCAVVRNGRIAAWGALLKHNDRTWEVAAVYTGEASRRQGLSKAIVTFVARHILSAGRVPILHTRVGNDPMRQTAESLGFTLTEE